MEPLKSRRSTYALLLLAIIAAGLAVVLSLVQKPQEIRKKAAPTAILQLIPQTSTVNQGDQFTIDVMIDAGGNQVIKTDLTINYDPTYLDGLSFVPGTYMPTDPPPTLPGIIQSGTARMILEAPTTTPRTGQGQLARLTFRAHNPHSATQIQFSASTQISALGDTGGEIVPVTLQPATVAINRIINPDTTLSLIGSAVDVTQDQQFTVTVQIDSGVNKLASTDLYVSFDPAIVQALSVNEAEIADTNNPWYMPIILSHTAISGGSLHIALGSLTNAFAQGPGSLARITFRAAAPGTTTVAIAPQTVIYGENSDENMLKTSNNFSVNVVGVIVPTPTPTATPTTNVEPTPTPNPCQNAGPSAPTNVTATAVSTSQIRLNWTAQSNVTHYSLVYGTAARQYSWGAPDVGNVSTFTVSGLAANTTYYFAVVSVNDCSSSGFSVEASARTQSPGYGGTQYKLPTPTPRAGKTPSPSPVFVRLDPSKGAENIPFLAAKPVSSAVPLPTVSGEIPKVSVPPEYTAPKTVNPLLTPIGGILLILAAIFLGIFFFRMRS